MTENEYTNEQLIDFMYDVMDWRDVVDHPMIYAVIEELKEIQQYRAIGLTPELIEAMQGHNIAMINDLGEYQSIGTIEEFKALKNKHIGKDNMVISSSDLMTILNSDSEELKQYKEVGTVEEFKALKENKRKCEDCAGCTNWKCDCANERDYAINEFANFLQEKAKKNNGLRLSSETRSWTHPCIFDYLKEFKEEQICKEET